MSRPSTKCPDINPDCGLDINPDRGADINPDCGSDINPDRGADTNPDRGSDTNPDHGADIRSDFVPGFRLMFLSPGYSEIGKKSDTFIAMQFVNLLLLLDTIPHELFLEKSFVQTSAFVCLTSHHHVFICSH